MSWLGWEGLELPDALSAASDLPVDGNDASLPSRGGVRLVLYPSLCCMEL